MKEEKKERKERVMIQYFDDGINRIHIPIRTEEEEKAHRKKLHDAAVRFLTAIERENSTV